MSNFGTTKYYLDVKEGLITGSDIIEITGTNPDVDIGVAEDIYGPGGTLSYPTANETVELFSANVADTSAGTGAQEVTITYMDEDHVVQTPVAVATNGGTVATGITDFFRLVEMKVTAVGATGWNEGVITLRVSGGGASRSAINFNAFFNIGANLALDSHSTVPAGRHGYIIGISSSIKKGADGIVVLSATSGDDGIFLQKFPLAMYNNSFVAILDSPIGPLPEKTDIKAICITENNNTEVQLTYQLLLVDD